MKKLIRVLLFGLGVSTLLSAAPVTKTFAVVPPDSCFQFSGGTILAYYNNQGNIISNPACPKNVDIPATIGGVAVTSIGPSAFSTKQLTSLTIPNSVTTIGNNAFQYNLLTSITLPNSIVSLGQFAFQNNQLSSVVLSTSLTSIGNNAFYYNQLSSISIPSSVTSIGSAAFGNNQLTSVTIPNTVTSVGDSAFQSNQLTSVTLSSGMTSIAPLTFYDNNLSSINIPSSVTSIDTYAFAANNIPEVTLPDSVTSLDDMAFIFQGIDFADLAGTYSNGYYTKVYTQSPSNPNGLSSSLYVDNEGGVDLNNNGTTDDWVSYGGHIINPSSATINYRDTSGNTLQASVNRVGDDTADYLISNDPNTYPAPADGTAYTASEQTALNTQLASAYYQLSDPAISETAPTISGYTLQSPSSPATLALTSRTNQLTFVYSSNTEDTESTPPTQPSGTESNQSGSNNNGLADTGTNTWILLALALLAILSGSYVIKRLVKL